MYCRILAYFEKTFPAPTYIGAEKAKAIADHAREVKAAGGKWCDCPACSAGLKILENAQLLK